MFEQIVRPFVSRPVTATRRVVPAVSDGSDTGTAVLTWGRAGAIERGAKQEEGEDLASVGFNVECCDDVWDQKGEPEREENRGPLYAAGTDNKIGEAVYSRVTEISFRSQKKNGCFQDLESWSYAAAGVLESIAGLEASIPAAKNCNSTFKLRYNN